MKRARLWTMAGWLVLMAAAVAWFATALKVDSDFSAFLPGGQTQAQRIFSRELREGVTSRLLLIELAHDDPRQLAAMSRSLARSLTTHPEFRFVANGEGTIGAPELALIERHRYQLSDRVDAAHFDAAALRAALEERLEGLAGGGGALEKRWLSNDPTGETLHILAQLAAPMQPRRVDGVWFARNGDAALLVGETRAPGWDVEGQQRAIAALERAFAAVRQDGAAQIRYSSPGAMSVASRTLIAADATRLSLASIILILGILLWVYRSVPVVLLCFLPAATGLVAGIVAVSAWFGTVQGITLGFGATLLGEAVDYPSFLLTQLRTDESVSDARTRLGPTLRMAILTTACGSLALLFADFPGLAQLGMLTMVGILTAGAMTYWVLPLWIPASRVRIPHSAGTRTPIPPLGAVARWGIVVVLAALVVALSWNRPWFDDDVANMNPLPAALKDRDRELREALGAPDVRYLLVVSGPTQEDVLRRAEELRPDLQRWVASGAIGGFDLVTDLLPSTNTQALRQALLPAGPRLAANLNEALVGLPFRPRTFDPFLADVEAARSSSALTLEAMAGNALGFRAESLLRRDGSADGEFDDSWYAVIPLRGVTDPAAIAHGAAAMGSAQVRWIDLRAESSQMMSAFRHRAMLYAGLGALLIFGVLAHGLRSATQAVRLMVPVMLAIALTAGTLVAAGAPLSVLHLVALLLVLGVGINYALFFARAAVAREDGRRTLRTLAVVSGTTLCAFGMLALSRIAVLQVIGTTVCIGVVISLVCCALLLFARDPG
jgi:predicted exporter